MNNIGTGNSMKEPYEKMNKLLFKTCIALGISIIVWEFIASIIGCIKGDNGEMKVLLYITIKTFEPIVFILILEGILDFIDKRITKRPKYILYKQSIRVARLSIMLYVISIVHYDYGVLVVLPILNIYLSTIYAERRSLKTTFLQTVVGIGIVFCVNVTRGLVGDIVLPRTYIDDFVLAMMTAVFVYVLCKKMYAIDDLRDALLHEAETRIDTALKTAETDSLTGLYNLKKIKELAEKFGNSITIAMIDIDDFKKTNDEHGHEFGNIVLKRLAGILHKMGSDTVKVGRYGGEEFIVICKGKEQYKNFVKALDERREEFAAQRYRDKDDYFVTFSCGVADNSTRCGDIHTFDEVVNAADMALYTVKKTRKNRVLYAEKSNLILEVKKWLGIVPESDSVAHLNLIELKNMLKEMYKGDDVAIQLLNSVQENSSNSVEMQIVEAIEDNRVEIFYQPIYDTRAKKFKSAEALVRMRDKDGTLVTPNVFIPVAEKSGLIVKLGETILERVCMEINSFGLINLGLDYIEVNLSAVQCTQKDLYDKLNEIIEKHGIDRKWLNFEITESARLLDKDVFEINMNKFLDDGIRFSLDDFGTGNSNIDYIVNVPVEIIKFDSTLTKGFFNDSRIRTIFKYIIPMINELNLEIVCEGVETEEQLREMEKFGVAHIQGYYFSKPLPVKDFVEFIKERNAE